MKRKSVGSVIALILSVIIFGVGVFLLSTEVYRRISDAAFMSNAVEISAVTDRVTSYTTGKRTQRRTFFTVYVSYEYNNVHYDSIKVSNYGSGAASLTKGSPVKVYIDPSSPSDCRVPYPFSDHILDGIIGAVVFIFGIYCIIISIKALIRKKRMSATEQHNISIY